MKMFNTTSKSLVIGASLLIAAGFVNAQGTLSDNGNTRDLGQSTFYSTSGASPSGSGFLGARSLTYTPTVGASSTFWAYCIDPRTGTGFPSTGYSASSLSSFLSGASNSGYAQQVANTGTGYAGFGLNTSSGAQTAVFNNLVNLYSHAYTDAIGGALATATQADSAKAAAFGMAVWEIIMQDGAGGFSRTTNNVRSNGGDNTSGNPGSDSVEAWTNAYLSALNTNSWGNVNGANLNAVTNFTYTVWSDTAPGLQNFLQVSSGSNNTVPLPGTLALVGLALLGAARVSRQRAIAA